MLAVVAIGVNEMKFELNTILINLAFIFLQLLFLTIYFSIRQKQVIDITKAYLGWGDILFWIALSFLFSPLNFFSFYFISMLLSLISALVIRGIRKEASTIPLAGIQAFVLVFVLVINFFFHFTAFQDDGLIENIISG